MNLVKMHEMLSTAFSQFQNVAVTKPMVMLWADAFKNTSEETFWAALVGTLKTNDGGFPPTIGQVNSTLMTFSKVPDDQLTEGEAWGLLLQCIKKFGFYQQAEAKAWLSARSARIAKCAELMGWTEICNWKTEDQPANRAHFWRIYLGLVNRDKAADMMSLPRPAPYEALEPSSRNLGIGLLVNNLVKGITDGKAKA